MIAAAPAKALAATPKTARLFSTESGKGRNLLLLHGWTADSNDWSWQLPVLESRYRIVAVDLRGHGWSEVMPSGAYRPADYVADIEALLDTRYPEERFVVIGHSMGGQLAARLAAKRPDIVDAVVSVDGSLGFDESLTPVFEKVSADLRAGDPGSVAPALFDQFYDPATSPAMKRWHARRAQGMPAHVVRKTFGPLFLGAGQVGVGAQSELFCRTLRVAFYHLCRDQAQAERMRPWFSHPSSKVEAWSDAGHWIMEDRPDDVNAALTDWIDSL
ncbi:alpha/beta fold hydrolase [Consotaella salsifontis]|uniref:Pimeloyl-ACP methyl ester carboxylesterase n=1 Tax=Consotaella salsifontis TaxID=1365950 RepID=A0A1T4NKG8_9HYPH|nr:alpha/beta hydrolase [Consotaella salsifontis]SJZ79764.1 Pimeloyl-ACP methyl ester carboxylesterase [Consotaella salsifontis]